MARWSTTVLRKRTWALGKRLFGAPRMAVLRSWGVCAQQRANSCIANAMRLQTWLFPHTRLRITSTVQLNDSMLLISGILLGRAGALTTTQTGNIVALTGHNQASINFDAIHYLDDENGTDLARDQLRFIATASIPADSVVRLKTEQRVANKTTVIRSRAYRLKTVDLSPLDRVRCLLALMPRNASARRAALDAVLGAAMIQCWQSRPDEQRSLHARGDLVRYNTEHAHTHPTTTLIIPIYGRHDFISFQLAAFVRDATLKKQELLYVIDDPKLHTAVRKSADALSQLHDIAFSILYLERNLGYAGANNAGARYAQAERLLLINSDVMPIADGWLDRMHAVSDATVGHCIVGARLLYEDESVQHDGMRFDSASTHDGLWLNIHPGKGMPADLFEHDINGLKREAVTGACLLIDKALYEQIGGLDEHYILGDFEDSDLCLKAHLEGVESRLASGATLYHLERQSQSLVSQNTWKNDLTWFNCWFHSRRWDTTIRELKAQTNHG